MAQAALLNPQAEMEQADLFAFPLLRDADLRSAFDLFGARPASPTAEAKTSARGFPRIAARPFRLDNRAMTFTLRVADWLVIAAAIEVAARWSYGQGLLALSIQHALAFLAAGAALKLGLWLTAAYPSTPAQARPEQGAGGLALGAVAGIAFASFVAPDARAAGALAAIVPIAAMLLAGIHASFALWMKAAHRKGAFAERIVLIGATDAAQRLIENARRTGDAQIVAVFDDRFSRAPQHVAGTPVAGGIDDLLAWDDLPHVDRIVIAVTQKAEARVRFLINRLRAAPNRIDLMLDYEIETVRGKGVDRAPGGAFACVAGAPRHQRHNLLKRAQDLLLSSAALVLTGPALAVIALAVKAESGDAFVRERRRGLNNRVISMLRFRTTDAHGRATRVGALLRRTGLDAAPLLFNVLKGEMSLVGPRAAAIDDVAIARAGLRAEYAQRARVKPGMTGWAQVRGVAGGVSPGAMRDELRYDLDYVARASLGFDLAIIARALAGAGRA